jgi:hypothetical protein
MPLVGGSTNVAETQVNPASSVIATAGTLSDLYVRLTATLVAGSGLTYTVYKNGSSTGLTLAFANGDGLVEKSDTDPAHNVTVAAGDRISILSGGTASTTSQTSVTLGLKFTSDDAKGMLIAAANTPPAAGATSYARFGGKTALNATQTNVSSVVAAPGTIDNLYGYVSTAPGTGETYTLTLVKNGSDTSLTETISGTGTATPAPTSNPVTVVAGDLISVKVVSSAAAAASGMIHVSVQWTPTTAGEQIQFAAATGALDTASVRYVPASGVHTVGAATEANTQNIAPCAFTAKKLYLDYQTAPGTGNSRSFEFRKNTANDGPTVTVSDTSTTGTPDTVNTSSVAAGDEIAFLSTPVSVPDAGQPYRIGWVSVA